MFDPISLDGFVARPTTLAPKDKTPVFKAHPTDEDALIFQIDNSTLEKFQTCPRAAEFYTLHRRESCSSAALVFGSALHECLERRYKGVDFNPAEVIASAFDNTVFPATEWRTQELALTVYNCYNRHYANDNLAPATHNDAPAVELPFALNLGVIDVNTYIPYDLAAILDPASTPITTEGSFFCSKIYVQWTGKIDVVGDYLTHRCIVDHKTTSMGGFTFFEDFVIRQQTVGYAWAASQLLSTSINHFLLNAIICRKPTRTGVGLEFERQLYHYPDWKLREWEQDVMSEVSTYLTSFIKGYFPKATAWCMGKYGACPYHAVCTTDPCSRDTLLNSDTFSNVNWSPLHK